MYLNQSDLIKLETTYSEITIIIIDLKMGLQSLMSEFDLLQMAFTFCQIKANLIITME